MTTPYRVPLEELERQVRTTRTEQVVLRGDGAGPPPVTGLGETPGDADGD